MPDDAVFLVECVALCKNLVREICIHRRAVLGMDQGCPSLHRVHITLVDSEDKIQYDGTCPLPCADIQNITAEAADGLRFSEGFHALLQCFFSLLAFVDIYEEAFERGGLSIGARNQPGVQRNPDDGAVL